MAGEPSETIELADVVAFLAAHVRGDEDACRALLAATDGVKLLGFAIEVAIEVACRELPGGREEFGRMLAGWQARRNAGL